MNVTKKHLTAFKRIINSYQKETTYPKRHEWKNLNDNKLWLRLIGQVNVVGGVNGNDRFFNRPDLLKKISLNALKKSKSDKELALKINSVLRESGIRYASSDLDKCNKTKALVHNFKFITKYKGGFRGMLQDLVDIKTSDAELLRVNFLTTNLKFIKNKSARDFLMGLGINQNTLALDIRIQNIFKHYGLDLPSQSGLSRRSIYDATEKVIIEKICTPLEIKPVKFDRILFQKYDQILKN